MCGIPYRGGGVFGFFTFIWYSKPFVYQCFTDFCCKFLFVSLLPKVKVKSSHIPYYYIMFRNFYIFEPIVKKCSKIDSLGNKWKNLSKPIYLQGFPVISLLWVCFPILLIQAKIVSKNQKLTPSKFPSNSPKPTKTQKFCQYFRKLLFFPYISFKDIDLPSTYLHIQGNL